MSLLLLFPPSVASGTPVLRPGLFLLSMTGAPSSGASGSQFGLLPIMLSGTGEDPTAGYIKVWTGSVWVKKPAKVWTGSAWVTKPAKYWNGSAWITTT